ncbi:AAA family ATPase [Salisediminibacterium selenitireducens]|uniref:AAA ATPase n=1 Tax=Bacillus selenitireducens (strain ATCC 700615 / DSM 15326 / MLS10) TaxID=439292 RepID=D6XZS6_BACIE|nr:AAA family ATPase [Salisediminibacterium selenitireducens]ADI00428.1 AAA ATPase [[Bacillus] selenitireducens MLS10]
MSRYMEQFDFPDADREADRLMTERRTCHDTYYPFQVMSQKGLARLDFEPITILCGGNGSGKTTALNVIADSLQAEREAVSNRTAFYEDYLRLCSAKRGTSLPEDIRIMTSDDVFDFLLTVRSVNQGIDAKREKLYDEYLEQKYTPFQMRSMDDYERLKAMTEARKSSQSQYVRKRLMPNTPTGSNGERAFQYFVDRIHDNGLYLLDEPENSLSPARQQDLADLIVDSARFFGCQFIVATHSPFFLAMAGAAVYDLDQDPPGIRHWTDLEHVRTYFAFFEQHRSRFE